MAIFYSLTALRAFRLSDSLLKTGEREREEKDRQRERERVDR
jgi:hypothetical protein